MKLGQIYKNATDMKPFIWMLYGLARSVKGDILEIGVRNGQTTLTFLKGIEDSGENRTLVSIDLRAPKRMADRAHKEWSFMRTNWEFIKGNSLSDEVHRRVKGRKFSILMIDGDHTYDYVKGDYEKYYPNVLAGGYILFHDILTETLGKSGEKCGAKIFWKELNEGITFHQNQWGLGLIQKPYNR